MGSWRRSRPRRLIRDGESKSEELNGKPSSRFAANGLPGQNRCGLPSQFSFSPNRNHRERKEKYIKSLEREVLRLRDEEAAILQESKSVQEENEVLKELLSRHGLPLPNIQTRASATVSVFDNPSGAHQLRVDMPGPDFYSHQQGSHVSPQTLSMSTSSPDTTIAPDQGQMHPEYTYPQSEIPPSATYRSPASDRSEKKALPSLPPVDQPPRPNFVKHPHGLDAPEIGIDFVLS